MGLLAFLGFIVAGLLLQNKGRKEDNKTMSVVGNVMWIFGLAFSIVFAVLFVIGLASF